MTAEIRDLRRLVNNANNPPTGQAYKQGELDAIHDLIDELVVRARIGAAVLERVDGEGYRNAGFHAMTRVEKHRCPVCWHLDERGHTDDCPINEHLDKGE